MQLLLKQHIAIEKEFLPYINKEIAFIFCNNIQGLLMKLVISDYSPS